MLCRLSTHIQTLQKDRDEAVRKSAYQNTAEFRKREDERWIDTLCFASSATMGNSIREPDIPHRNDLPNAISSIIHLSSPRCPPPPRSLKASAVSKRSLLRLLLPVRTQPRSIPCKKNRARCKHASHHLPTILETFPRVSRTRARKARNNSCLGPVVW